MDIVAVTRNMEQHKLHVMRIRNMQPSTDTSTPKSLGLKHLATRPKKQQLIDDRQQDIAKENKKLMERMTKIMTNSKPQEKHIIPQSRAFSKLEVDRINFENKLLNSRLRTVTSTFDLDGMREDFERHKKVSDHLRRRQVKPLGHKDSTSKKGESFNGEGSFDSGSYLSAQSSNVLLNGGSIAEGSMVDSPIKSMADFRRHVLSTKKMPNGFIQPPGR